MHSRWYLALGFTMYWGCNCLLWHLLLLQDVNSRVIVTRQGNIAEDGLHVDGEVRDLWKSEVWEESKWTKMVCSGSLAPCFVNDDCVTAEITYRPAPAVMRYSLGRGLLLFWYMSSTQNSGGITAASWLCPLGQPPEERIQRVYSYGCCVSQRLCMLGYAVAAASLRRECAFPAAPSVFFQPLSSCLAYPGFSEQWEQRNNLDHEQDDQWYTNVSHDVLCI